MTKKKYKRGETIKWYPATDKKTVREFSPEVEESLRMAGKRFQDKMDEDIMKSLKEPEIVKTTREAWTNGQQAN